MTKFDNVAISHRKKSKGESYTAAELRRNIMEFQRTGVHPELKAREESNTDASSSLPMHNPGRAHAFMDIAVGKDPIGTLVIEVFDDIAPNAAREFILRVSDDGGAGRAGDVKYANTEIHMIADGVNVDGGRAPGMKPPTGGGGVPIEEAKTLTHCEAGVVSLKRDSPEYTIALHHCHHLDGARQVVGRVVKGLDHLSTLSEIEVDDQWEPMRKVMVTTCGVTTWAAADGGTLSLAAETRAANAAAAAARAAKERGESKEETKKRLDMESAALGAGLKRSLADGIAAAAEAERKRAKVDAAAAPKPVWRGGMMDAMLGELSDSDGDDSDGDED
jgi:NK-tumor recognition protein